MWVDRQSSQLTRLNRPTDQNKNEESIQHPDRCVYFCIETNRSILFYLVRSLYVLHITFLNNITCLVRDHTVAILMIIHVYLYTKQSKKNINYLIEIRRREEEQKITHRCSYNRRRC